MKQDAPRVLRALRLTVVFALSVAATPAAAQEPARFRTTFDVTSVVDVAVVDGDGHPVTGLVPGDFNVWIDGEPRRVISAEWVAVEGEARERAANVSVPEAYTSNEVSGGGRLIVIAVDQASIRFGGSTAIMRTLGDFIDKLLPTDRVGVVGFGPGAGSLAFLSDPDRAQQIMSHMTGLRRPDALTTYNIGLSESLSILRGELRVLDDVVTRECGNISRFLITVCRSGVEYDAVRFAREALDQANVSITGLVNLFTSLRKIDAPKVVVLLSEGFVVDDSRIFAERLGQMAAAARSSLYVLHLNETVFSHSRRRPPPGLEDRRARVFGLEARADAVTEDRRARVAGLEALADAARGSLFTISGAGTGIIDRIQAEISGYYLLGLEPGPRDRDGEPHPIRIEVPWNGAIVRSHRQMLNAVPTFDRRAPAARMAANLESPLPTSSLPMRVATFALRAAEPDSVQLLIHADIGTDYTTARLVALGYSIVDEDGQEVDVRRFESTLGPVMNGVPSALQFAAGANLAPGEYTLRLAADDGQRAGSVEHRFRAQLSDSDGVKLSELVAGGPTSAREFLSPTVGYTVSFGSLQGYLEAYGDQAEAVTVKYEVAAGLNADALLVADVPGRLFGEDRMIFSHVMLVRELPPGPYVLRALVSVAGRLLETLARGFEVSRPAPVEAAADDPDPAADADVALFLPVDEKVFVHPFVRDAALKTEVLQPFRDRLASGAAPAFQAALTALTAGSYQKAELALKSAVQPEIDSTPLFAYLGVVYAAMGNDFQAAGAWQTALVNGEEMPQLYAWLAQALLRARHLLEAQDTLEEAHGKWPSDTRFTGALASVYAAFGKGREAVLLLEQYLDGSPGDIEAARIGVEWLYQVHTGDRVVHSRAEDLALAHSWATRYGNGPQTALVRQWLAMLDREGR